MSDQAQLPVVCNCGKQYYKFYNYKNHFLKMKCQPKQPMSQPESATVTPEPVTITSQIPNINSNNTNTDHTENNQHVQPKVFKFNRANVERMLADRKKVNCEYCEQQYSPSNIARHKQLHCKHRYKVLWEYEQLLKYGIKNIPQTESEVREMYYTMAYENKLQNNNRYQPSTSTISQQIINNNNTQNNSVGVLNQTVNQTVNQTINNNITQNIIQNNIVIIQPVMNEDLSHISIEEQKAIIILRAHAYKKLLDHIYSNRANHNVAFTDKPGKKKVKLLDSKLGVTNGDSYDKLGDISMNHLAYLDNYIQKHKNTLPDQYKNDIKFLEDFITNESNNDTLIYQFFDKVDCISNSAKEMLDLHDKQKINEFVSGLIKQKQLMAIEEQAKTEALLLTQSA